jgi:hypothetical protein
MQIDRMPSAPLKETRRFSLRITAPPPVAKDHAVNLTSAITRLLTLTKTLLTFHIKGQEY